MTFFPFLSFFSLFAKEEFGSQRFNLNAKSTGVLTQQSFVWVSAELSTIFRNNFTGISGHDAEAQ
jgi:hypothetical protein